MDLLTTTAPQLKGLQYSPGQPDRKGRDGEDDERARVNDIVFAEALDRTATRAADPAAGEPGPGFGDFLDVINPLQHVPVLSSLYRGATGDTISAPARLLGGMLFGGPIGLGIALANVISEDISGQDVGEHMVGLVTGETARTAARSAPDAKGKPDAGNETEQAGHDANQRNGTTQLAQYEDVRRWAESEARFRTEALQARGIGTKDGIRQADSFVESALLNGAMKAAMKEYDTISGLGRRDDHMELLFDLES